MILKWEYRLLLLILQKFSKILLWRLVILLKRFTWKKVSFAYKEWTKTISKEAKRQGKRLKAIRKNHIDKNQEKEGILCEAGATYMKVPFSTMVKNAFLPFFYLFCPFQAWFYPFIKWSSCPHLLEYKLQCYYHFHILYDLVTYIYMYK